MQPSIPHWTSAGDWIFAKSLSRRIHLPLNSSPESKIGLHSSTRICFFCPKPGGFSDWVNTRPCRSFPGYQCQVIRRKTFVPRKIRLRKNWRSGSKIRLHRRNRICFFCPNPGGFSKRVNTRSCSSFPGYQCRSNRKRTEFWKISVGGNRPCWTPYYYSSST